LVEWRAGWLAERGSGAIRAMTNRGGGGLLVVASQERRRGAHGLTLALKETMVSPDHPLHLLRILLVPPPLRRLLSGDQLLLESEHGLPQHRQSSATNLKRRELVRGDGDSTLDEVTALVLLGVSSGGGGGEGEEVGLNERAVDQINELVRVGANFWRDEDLIVVFEMSIRHLSRGALQSGGRSE
jgi:hypothetical protein